MNNTSRKATFSKDVYLIWTAGFFYMCCANCTIPIIAGYSESLGASGFWMGIISSLLAGSAVVCRPFVGGLADRITKFPMVLGGCLLMMAANWGFVVFPYIESVVVLRIVQGIGYACCSIGLSTWLTMLLPADKLGSGVGLYSVVNSLGLAFSLFIGIRIRNLFGYRWCFFIAGAFALVTALLIQFIGNRKINTCKVKRTGVPKLLSVRVIPIALALLFAGIPYAANQSFLVSYVDGMEKSVRPDLFFTMNTVMLLILRFALHRLYDRISYTRFLLFCSLSSLGALISLHFMQSYLLMFFAAMFTAGGYGILVSVSQSAAAIVSDAEHRGVAMATCYLGMDLGSALGSVVGGLLYGNFDLCLFYPLLSIFVIACGFMYFPCKRIYRVDLKDSLS